MHGLLLESNLHEKQKPPEGRRCCLTYRGKGAGVKEVLTFSRGFGGFYTADFLGLTLGI